MFSRYRMFLRIAAAVVLVAFVGACKTTTSAGRQVDDAAIKTAVKAKLAADVRLSTLTNIEVNSTNGVVTLAGMVNTQEEKMMAGDVARGVDGVVRVNNELQVVHLRRILQTDVASVAQSQSELQLHFVPQRNPVRADTRNRGLHDLPQCINRARSQRSQPEPAPLIET